MMRFIGLCVLLAAGCAAAIIYAGEIGGWLNNVKPDPEKEAKAPVGPNGAGAAKAPEPDEKERPVAAASPRFADGPVRITGTDGVGLAMSLILQDGRVLPLERREVPSERDGKLLLLATPVPEDEFVPKDKLERLWISILGVKWTPGDEKRIAKDREYSNRRPVIVEPFRDPDYIPNPADKAGTPETLYRLPLPGDSLAPGTTKIIRLPVKFRRLSEDDEVEAGQFIGVINPAVALEELGIKQAKVEAAAAEVQSSASLKAESIRREVAMRNSRQKVRGSVSDDDYYAAVVTIDRYAAEEVSKKAAVVQAQQELSGAWTTLDLYFIKAPISGRIRTLYKQQGEAVKNLDAVLQLQNTRRLRVEAQVEVQDALPLQERVRRAEAKRFEAKRLEKAKPTEAEELRRQADVLTQVFVEITRPVPPKAVLSGHLGEVTCVAVTRAPLTRIISGSEDGIVRVWDRVAGEDRWYNKLRLDHRSPIRAVACSGKEGKNVLVTATSRGQVRVWDLDNLSTKSEPIDCGKGEDNARHQGAVNAIAISHDGKQAATGGEDRSIIVWNLQTGEKVDEIKRSHNAHVTWLAFTPDGLLVSASRDRELRLWERKGGKWDRRDDPIGGRTGEVSTLSLSPDGKSVLFDVGNELRVLSLADRHTESSMTNVGASGAFTTMALFSPDGKTIMTNGNGPGRLQLWRAPRGKIRAAELRQLLWTTGNVTCGAFDPSGAFAVTGTNDQKVLVWQLPGKEEAESPSDAQLTYVEENLDSGLKKVTVRATITNAPEGVNPGSSASIVVPPLEPVKPLKP